jgi:hypothetical protein
MKSFLILLGLQLAPLFLAGCQTPPPAGQGSLAWVEIDGRTGAEIRQATVEVFQKDGYHLKTNSVVAATFEKPGGAMNNLAYGGWDSGVTIRVIVHVDVQNNGTHLLHCEAFMVRDVGDRSVEDARPIHFRRGPYQGLLNRVKAKLQSSS